MPNWLQSIIPGDPAAAVGIAWNAGEKERLARVLRAKAERHDRKFDKINFKGEYNMKHKQNILEALKSGPMTTDQLVEKTGIGINVLYATLSGLASEGLIEKKNVDGGRGRLYSLPDGKNETPRYAPATEQRPEETGKVKLPPRPVLRSSLVVPSAAPASIGMFKPGDKFLIMRNAQQISILAKTLGLVTIQQGQPIEITAEESATARPIVHLKAEVYQTVSI